MIVVGAARERRGALVLLVGTVLLAAGVRLSEDPAVAAAARAVRTRPLDHVAAAAGWAAQALWSSPAAGAAGTDGLRPRRKAMAMIRIRNLEKAVRSGTGSLFLLRNVNLAVEKGDFLTLMGPSGAGKSTLLAVLGMLDADWTGEFELDGNAGSRDVRQGSAGARPASRGLRLPALPPAG